MKLELKHIAPYLPYKLQWHFEGEDFSHEVSGVELNTVHLLSPYNDYGRCTIDEGNPVLRPLSDLSKPLNHISYTRSLIGGDKDLVIPSELFRDNWFLTIRNDGYFSINNGDGTCTGFSYQSASYSIISLLLEWHFDVFGLIPAGLAMDINQTNPSPSH